MAAIIWCVLRLHWGVEVGVFLSLLVGVALRLIVGSIATRKPGLTNLLPRA